MLVPLKMEIHGSPQDLRECPYEPARKLIKHETNVSEDQLTSNVAFTVLKGFSSFQPVINLTQKCSVIIFDYLVDDAKLVSLVMNNYFSTLLFNESLEFIQIGEPTQSYIRNKLLESESYSTKFNGKKPDSQLGLSLLGQPMIHIKSEFEHIDDLLAKKMEHWTQSLEIIIDNWMEGENAYDIDPKTLERDFYDSRSLCTQQHYVDLADCIAASFLESYVDCIEASYDWLHKNAGRPSFFDSYSYFRKSFKIQKEKYPLLYPIFENVREIIKIISENSYPKIESILKEEEDEKEWRRINLRNHADSCSKNLIGKMKEMDLFQMRYERLCTVIFQRYPTLAWPKDPKVQFYINHYLMKHLENELENIEYSLKGAEEENDLSKIDHMKNIRHFIRDMLIDSIPENFASRIPKNIPKPSIEPKAQGYDSESSCED